MKSRVLVAAVALLASPAVFASGYEKSIMWGGQTSGVAGIATPYIQGSQALYFNPAGLVSDKAGQYDVSVNVSPTIANYKEANDASSDQTSSNRTLLPLGITVGSTIGDKLGVGLGYYVSGGSYGDFTGESISVNPGLESKLDLTITEFALGAGYKVLDNLKIGASYRVVMVNANLDIVEAAAGGLAALESNNSSLKQTKWTGFKLGAQYKLNEKWDLGLTYRSEVDFNATGNQVNTLYQGGSQVQQTSSSVTANTLLPAAWNLGATWAATDTWKILAEYEFIQYSKVTNLGVSSFGQSNPLVLNFKDEHQIKVAAEYKGWAMPIRFGYIYTSQVTDGSHMLPGLPPPGAANTITLGTGQAFAFGGQSLRADGGLEYTFLNGSSNGGAYSSSSTTPSPVYTTGSNSLTAMGIHLGVSYMF